MSPAVASLSATLIIFVAVTCQTEGRILPRAVLETTYVNNVGIDNYEFEFQTPNGITRKEKGFFSNGVWTVIGEVSWFADDGKLYSYSYAADDKGYRQSEAPSTVRPVRPFPRPPTSARPLPAAPAVLSGGGVSCSTQASLLGCGK